MTRTTGTHCLRAAEAFGPRMYGSASRYGRSKDRIGAMTSGKVPRYWHPSMGKKIWSSVPDDLPTEKHRRWMAWEGMRKSARIAQQVVYYVRMPDESSKSGQIKIGTTTNLTSRLLSLERAYGGGPPEVLATEPGGHDIEQQRHGQFSHLSHGGFHEYFEPGHDLLAFIQQVRSVWGEPMITDSIPADWPWSL